MQDKFLHIIITSDKSTVYMAVSRAYKHAGTYRARVGANG